MGWWNAINLAAYLMLDKSELDALIYHISPSVKCVLINLFRAQNNIIKILPGAFEMKNNFT